MFGTTPLTLKLRPGNSYDLTFTRAGYATVTRHYKFDGHGPQILRVSLKKIPEVHKAPAPRGGAQAGAAHQLEEERFLFALTPLRASGGAPLGAVRRRIRREQEPQHLDRGQAVP